MNSAVPDPRASRRGFELRSSLDFAGIALWLVASLIALFFALVLRDSTIVGDAYIPRGNDSFYHARRILDAAIGARGFYQFDERLHAPDGAWVGWPWAYDYLMAQATRVTLWANPLLDPMVASVYVPVAWIFVNSALFLAAAGAIGLSTRDARARDAVFRAVAADAVAARRRHGRPPLRRAHVRAARRLARVALVRATK